MQFDPTSEWRALRDTPYQISNTGQIRSTVRRYSWPAGYIVRTRKNAKGYLRASLTYLDGRKIPINVAREVAIAFIGPSPAVHFQINHIDGKRANNRSENLEWVLPKENMAHAMRTGLANPAFAYHVVGQSHGQSKLTDADVRAIRAISLSTRKLATRFGVSHMEISRIKARIRWGHID